MRVSGSRRRPHRLAAVAVITVAVLLTGQVAAPASEGARKSSAKSKAQAYVKKASKPVEFEPPGPAIPSIADAKGKTVWFISGALAFPFTQAILTGMEDAADLAGINFESFDAQSNPTEATRLLGQAEAANVDAVVLMNFGADFIEQPIRQTIEAGIPVINLLGGGTEPFPTGIEKDVGTFGFVGYSNVETTKGIANLVISEKGCDFHTLLVNVPFAADPLFQETYDKTVTKACPDVTTDVQDAPIEQWNTVLGPIATAAVADQDTNVIFPVFEAMIGIMEPAVLAADAQDRVGFISTDPNSPTMKQLADGELVLGMSGAARNAVGWAAIDQVLRALLDMEPTSRPQLHARLFTQKVAKTLDVNDEPDTWYGNGDPSELRDAYAKLWNVSSG